MVSCLMNQQLKFKLFHNRVYRGLGSWFMWTPGCCWSQSSNHQATVLIPQYCNTEAISRCFIKISSVRLILLCTILLCLLQSDSPAQGLNIIHTTKYFDS